MDENYQPLYPPSAYTMGAEGAGDTPYPNPMYPGDDGRGFQMDFPQRSQSYGHEGYYPLPVPSQQQMITRTQNYPPPLPVLAEMQNTIIALTAQLAENTRIAAEAKAEAKAAALQVQEARAGKEGEVRKEALQAKAKLTKIQVSYTPIHPIALTEFAQAIMQSKFRWALGINVLGKDNEVVKRLPHPLGPDQEQEYLADKETKRTHPNWLAGVSDLHNLSICVAIGDLVMEHIERDKPATYGNPTPSQVLRTVKKFYGSLRKTYTAQNTPEGQLRRRRKCALTKHRGRRVEKARNHRKTVPKLREVHGEENTVGDYDMIHTTDMSSEHSDCGNVNQTVFQAYRQGAGGGEGGWEVRRKHYRSSWLNLYLAHLKTLRRTMLADAKEQPDATGASTGHRVARFKGMPENADHSAPGLTRKKPLTAWMERTSTTYSELRVLPDPAHFTVFKLQMSRAALHPSEMAYLADDESA
ncbi:hypothetical protein C8R47DRAFT_1206819 [Mycena vitilis]|nr:hypothetical protein C8R47DRAFT_1206819 [Mycena vitilis]